MANTIEMKITLNGAGEVVAKIKGVERATRESTNNQSSSWNKVSKDLEKFSSKADSVSQKLHSGLFAKIALGVASAAQVAPPLVGAIGAVGASFGAAGLAVGVFGLMAKTVLTQGVNNAKKLSQMEASEANATTAKRRAAIQQQINDLQKAGGQITDLTGRIKDDWGTVSSDVTTSALINWMKALDDGMQFLEPLVQPVANQFSAWGKTLDQYFSSSKGSTEVTKMATALGKFAGRQLKDIGTFFIDIGKAIAHLAGDIHGANFGAFGNDLAKWGAAFLSWSSSSAARADVAKFMAWLHGSGGQLVGVVKALAADLPAIFNGLKGAGGIELTGISTFLTLLAKLPTKVLTAIVTAAPFVIVLSKGIQLVAAATKAWAAAQVLLDAAMDGNPFGLIVLGIAALVTALVIAWQTSAKFRDIVINAFSVVGQVVLTFAELWLDEMHVVADGMLDAAHYILVGVKGIAQAIDFVMGTHLANGVQTAIDSLTGFKKGVDHTFDAAHNKIEGWKHDLANMPKVAKLKGDISDLTNKLNAAKRQLSDPHLTATKRAQIQANIAQLQNQLAIANQQLNAINGKTANTYVITRQQFISDAPAAFQNMVGAMGRAAGGAVGAAATGGARNGLVMVGEHGREVVRLPGGSTVRSNSDTEAAMAGGGGGSVIQLEIIGGNGPFESALAEILREFVRVKGGGNVQRALGRG